MKKGFFPLYNPSAKLSCDILPQDHGNFVGATIMGATNSK